MSDNSKRTAVADLTPIIVTSPAVRCGTTLVQRLLSSSPDTLIYGEPCAADLEFGLQMLAHKLMIFRQNAAGHERLHAATVGGTVNAWISDLMPSQENYINGLVRGAVAGLEACRNDAAQNGRSLWGIKYPGWSPWTVSQVRELMPFARWVVVCRDLEGTLKSAKTWKGISSTLAVEEFCRAWATNYAFYRSLANNPQVLLLNYGAIVSDPDALVAALQGFTGAAAIDRDVLDFKVNSAGGDYRAPIELTDADREIVAAALASIDS